MMTLPVFLEHFNKQKNLPDKLIIGFAGREYPLLFFSQMMSFLHKKKIITETVSVETADSSLIKAHLSTISFSGQIVYWLNDFHMLSIKKQQEWIVYFQAYTGPHKILFFCGDECCIALLKNINNGITVSIPHEMSLQDLSMIRFFINDDTAKVYPSINAGLQIQVVSLDTLCLLSYYELVVGKNWNIFFNDWGPYLLEQTSSLFLLSQYFFGKKSHLFFSQWSRSCDVYTSSFWPTFWADQVWRAYVYCDLMQQKRYVEAKKIQYKLPYSLINRDWSSLQLTELKHAHHYLSQMDYRLKNGGSSVVLELFFDMFFQNKFKL